MELGIITNDARPNEQFSVLTSWLGYSEQGWLTTLTIDPADVEVLIAEANEQAAANSLWVGWSPFGAIVCEPRQ